MKLVLPSLVGKRLFRMLFLFVVVTLGHIFFFSSVIQRNYSSSYEEMWSIISVQPTTFYATAVSVNQSLTSLNQIRTDEVLSELKRQLPTWMTGYFEWHNEIRSQLNESNWNQTEYLVLSCLQSRSQCGGISDRLKPLPYVVWQAAVHKRLLFIDWERPTQLEQFMIPPRKGVDWRLPRWLKPLLDKKVDGSLNSCSLTKNRAEQHLGRKEKTVLRSFLQATDGCEASFLNLSQSSYADVYHGLFRVFFEPVDRIEKKIDNLMTTKGLVPGKYGATHLRNMYGNRVWRHPNETIAIVVNGVNCASRQVPGGPVYFASDDDFAVRVALAYAQQYSLPIVSLAMEEEPLHLDKDDAWKTREPSEYDDTFIDLYMLGQAQCVAYSNGGYGTFGSILSYNASCGIRFFKGRELDTECNWTDAHDNEKLLPPPIMNFPPEMYVDPS